MKRFLKLLALLGLAATLASNAFASTLTYNNQSAFLAAISNPKIDDFNGPGFNIYTNAQMQTLSQGHVGYHSTGWGNLNVVLTGTLCWGCNGSGYMDLTATNVGGVNGVYGFAADVHLNTGYNAYLTFGDNSTMTLSNPLGFIGFTSDLLIKRIEFAHSPGQTSIDSFVSFDEVIIGAPGTQVPEPASVALQGLGLLALFAMRRKLTLAPIKR